MDNNIRLADFVNTYDQSVALIRQLEPILEDLESVKEQMAGYSVDESVLEGFALRERDFVRFGVVKRQYDNAMEALRRVLRNVDL